jgi:hypothetical protein
MSTLALSTISNLAGTASTSSDNVINGSAKAWVNFSATSGVTTINASYNVSSVTYVSTGIYTMNFTNAFADTKYGWSASSGFSSVNGSTFVSAPPSTAISTWKTTTSLRIASCTSNATPTSPNSDDVSIMVLR